LPVTLALLVGAGFESSAWIGGVTFALAAPTVGVVLLISARRRLHFLLGSAIAAALALALVFPLAHDQYAATALRGPTLALEPIGVFEDFISEQVSAIIDLPGYWLIMLLIEFPAIYLPGAVALAQILRSRLPTPETKGAVRAFAALIVVSFSVAWLIASTIGENDDLGWRAILPGVMGLTIFAAVGLSRWLLLGVRFATIIVFGALLLGLPDGALLIYHFAIGSPKPSRAVFAATPAMWEAVRRHSAPTDRIANNPLFLHDMTNWPVNISWALLANRNSCYAGKELALAFASLSDEQREAIDAQFVRVFAGSGSIDDVQELATRYNCRLVVLTAEDGAWNNDPFSANSRYHLVEAASDKWRIYAVANQALSGTETK
jgi:hypothetical protein